MVQNMEQVGFKHLLGWRQGETFFLQLLEERYPSRRGGETWGSFRDKLYSFTRQPLSELFLIVYKFRHGPLHAPHSLQPDRDPATRSSPIPASWHCGDERCPQCPARGHLRASCPCCHQLAATHTAGYTHPHGLVGFLGVSS